MKTGALVDLALRPDAAVMALDDAAYACQADPSAFEVFHAVQALEYAEQLVGVGHVEPHAVVADAHLDFALMHLGADFDTRRVTPAGVLDGVADEVLQRQVDERRVGNHLRQRGDIPDDFAALVVRGQLGANGVDQGIEVDIRQAQGRTAHLREVQQVVHQAAGKMRRFFYMLQKTSTAFAQALALDLAQQLGVAGDMPQGRTQVVGHAVGKGFEFLVRTAQLACQLRQLFGLAQDDAQHGGAQFNHTFDDQRVPGLAITAHVLLPAFEAVPRVQLALRAELFRRLPGPVHRAHLFRAEPHQVVRMDLRDGHRQHTAGMGRQLRQLVDVAAYVVAVEYRVFTALGQPMHQRRDLRLRWRLADQVAAVGRDHRSAAGVGELQQDLGQVAQAVTDAVMVGHRRNHAHDVLAQVEQFARAGVGLARFDLQRQHAGQQLAGGASRQAHRARLIVVTGHQPPQLPVDHDRQRHRRQGAHVAHVLQVHRRHAA
ncbi:hypothetical protein D3C76_144110 [compost metagenome]